MSIVSEVLREYFRGKKISQEEIGKILGVSQQSVQAYLGGRQPFGKVAAKKWSEAFGLNMTWLMTGEGSMFEGQSVSNNTAGGDMIINSPGATAGSDGTDVRVYKDLLSKAQNEIIELKAKIYQLMDKLTENGIDCDC